MRSHNALLAYEAVEAITEGEPVVDMIDWVADQSNILLTNCYGDLSLFEAGKNPLIVTGHYYFRSRGKAAIVAAKEFISEVFDLGVQTIVGLTPLTNLGARWMSRHVGFRSHGVVHNTKEPCELFIMHHTEFKQ